MLLFVFSLAVKFSEWKVVFATKAGVCYITLAQKLYQPIFSSLFSSLRRLLNFLLSLFLIFILSQAFG